MTLLSSGDLGFGYEEGGEVAAVGVEEEELEEGGYDAGANGSGGKQKSEEQDVDADGAEEHEAEGNESARDKEQAADALENPNDGQPVVIDHQEGPGTCIAGRHGCGDELVELVRAEDEKHEAEKQTADQSCDFHELS
jgi:hypothetical protein